MKCDLDYINCQLSDDIEMYRNKVMIKIIDVYLNNLRDDENCMSQVGGGRGAEHAEERIGDIDGVLGHFGSSIGKSVSSSIFNSTGDLIKNAIGAIVGILPVGGTVFEVVSTVDEMSTIAMLQFINSFPIFFRSYLEFLHTLEGIDADLSNIGNTPTDVEEYFNSIKEQFEIGNLAKSVAFGKQHRSHLGDTKSLLGAQFREGSKTGATKQQKGEDKAPRKGINEIVNLVFAHVTSLNDDVEMNFINRRVIEGIKERKNHDVNRLINCLTEWSVSAGSRDEWQTFSFQLQEYLDLRSSFQEGADDSYGNAIKRSLLKASITTEKIFDQGILGSGVIMAFALYMINNIEVYKDLCLISLIYWIHISKCILADRFKPPPTDNVTHGHPDLSGGFSCLNDFMEATEINDDVILAELNIYPQLLDKDINYVNDVIKQVIITNMKFMSLCYRIFKVLDDIKQRPFDSAIGVLQAFFEVGSNILDLVDGEISKTK